MLNLWESHRDCSTLPRLPWKETVRGGSDFPLGTCQLHGGHTARSLGSWWVPHHALGEPGLELSITQWHGHCGLQRAEQPRQGQLWLTHSHVLILREVYNPEGFKPPLKHPFLLLLWDKLAVKSCGWCRKESWGWKWKVKKANKKAHHRAISLPAGGSSSSPLPTNSSIYKRAFNCSSVSFLFIICIVLATFQNAEGSCLLSEELIQSLCNPETKLTKKRRKWCS